MTTAVSTEFFETLSDRHRNAWLRLLAEFSIAPGPRGPSGSRPRMPLSGLPGGQALWLRADVEAWVACYEQHFADLGRQARKRNRGQDGVFYTPRALADFLVGRSLGQWLNGCGRQIEQAMQTGDDAAARAVCQQVRQVRLIDPACGTGIFLVSAFFALRNFYQDIYQRWPQLALPDPARHVLACQLYGIDVDPLAVAIAQARLLAHAGLREEICSGEEMLPLHLRTGNTLLGPIREPDAPAGPGPASAGPWPAVYAGTSTWEWILGNPPYVSEVRGQTAVFRPLQTLPYYRAKMDLCDAFMGWAIDHLAAGGQMAFVLPEYWTQRTGTDRIREALWTQGQVREFYRLNGQTLFAHAPGHHTSLLVWEKGLSLPAGSARPILYGERITPDAPPKPAVIWRDPRSGKLVDGDAALLGLLDRLAACPPLLSPVEIQQGLVIPQGRLRGDDTGLFLLSPEEVQALNLSPVEQALLKPYFRPVGFAPYGGFDRQEPDYRLIYADARTRKRLAREPALVRLRAHLDCLAEHNTSAFAPYGLHRPRQPVWFEPGEKILCPRQVMRPAAAVVTDAAYVGEGFYVLRPKRLDPHAVCALLNSRMGWFWLYMQKRKGHRLQIDKDVLTALPAPMDLNVAAGELAGLSRQAGQGNAAAAAEIDRRVFELYGVEPADERAVAAMWQKVFGET